MYITTFFKYKPVLHYITYHHKTATEWVTFVHGAGGSSSIWFKQIREFKKHYNVLLLDLRGHGNSKSSLKNVFNEIIKHGGYKNAFSKPDNLTIITVRNEGTMEDRIIPSLRGYENKSILEANLELIPDYLGEIHLSLN